MKLHANQTKYAFRVSFWQCTWQSNIYANYWKAENLRHLQITNLTRLCYAHMLTGKRQELFAIWTPSQFISDTNEAEKENVVADAL